MHQQYPNQTHHSPNLSRQYGFDNMSNINLQSHSRGGGPGSGQMKRGPSPVSGNAAKRARHSPGLTQGRGSAGHLQSYGQVPMQGGRLPSSGGSQHPGRGTGGGMGPRGMPSSAAMGTGRGGGPMRGFAPGPSRQQQLPNFDHSLPPRPMPMHGRPPHPGASGGPQLVRPTPTAMGHSGLGASSSPLSLSGVLPGKRTPQARTPSPMHHHQQQLLQNPLYHRQPHLQGILPIKDPASALQSGARAPSPHQPSPSRRTPSPLQQSGDNDIEVAIGRTLVPGRSVRDLSSLLSRVLSVGEAKMEGDEYTYVLPERGAPQFHCDMCGNMNQGHFVSDKKSGDTICMGKDNQGCGNVVQDRKVHEGSMYRKFEGEEDRSHHGPVPNNLFSAAHNLQTYIVGGVGTKDAGNFRRTSEMVEMNLSNMGEDKGDRRTRTGYKDQQKKKAFELMGHVAANLDLHDMVVERAKEIFAVYRNVREHVHDFEAVIAACMIGAYREVGKKEKEAAEKRGESPPVYPGMRPRSLTEEELHPFQCPHCQARFNARRAFVAHGCARKQTSPTKTANGLPPLHPLGQFQGGGGNSAFRSSGPTKPEPAVAVSDVPIQKWDLSEALSWLGSLDGGRHKIHLHSFQKYLQTEVQKKQNSGRGRGRTSSKRTCAGQILYMANIHKLTQVCHGDAESAHLITKNIGVLKTHKTIKAKQDKEEQHFLQRQNQLEMKPWLKVKEKEDETLEESTQQNPLYSP